MKKTKFKLPVKWYIKKAEDQDEADLIAKYANPLVRGFNPDSSWQSFDSFRYHLLINNGEYVDGIGELTKDYSEYKKLSFDKFKEHVLNMPMIEDDYSFLTNLLKEKGIR